MMVNMIKKVKEFYIAFKQEEFLGEYGITPDRMKVRTKLWNEELEELIEAKEKKDKVQILDAIVDMIYIRIGTLLEHHKGDVTMVEFQARYDTEIKNCIEYFTEYFGHNSKLLEDAFDEVHKSNMSKLDENGNPIFREDGKVMKSHLFSEPDLKSILEKYEEI